MSDHKSDNTRSVGPVRQHLYELIFEADTRAGKIFDILLLIFILGSVMAVILESVPSFDAKYHQLLLILEIVFTVFFTIEYFLRIYTVRRPIKYITSFYGIVDLLSILPTYLSIFFAGTHSLMVIRALRLLRVFRIFKLGNFLIESQVIMTSLKASRNKISVFLFFILVIVTIFGSVMYLVEGSSNSGFDTIPHSIYWCIVTLTTVGYGDISPITPFGRFIASAIMILGYAVIAVPTGIITTEFANAYRKDNLNKGMSTQVCGSCLKEGHDEDADYCKFCGENLH